MAKVRRVSTLSLYGFCDPICEFLFLNLSDLLGVVVCGSTTLVILGLSCWICGFLVKFLAVCVFVNLGLHYSRGGARRFGSGAG
jgi:hypothetical protein